jgi:hypothetical protein
MDFMAQPPHIPEQKPAQAFSSTAKVGSYNTAIGWEVGYPLLEQERNSLRLLFALW